MKINAMYKVGTDIVEVSRIDKLIDRYKERFLNRIFTPDEIIYCQKKHAPSIHFAGRFSAKEAVLKAVSFMSNSPIPFSSINIQNDSKGRPVVICDEIESNRIDLSISHTKQHAIAFAIYDLND